MYDFSSSHHDSLRDTISWERVVKDDCVRSCLKELKSFLLCVFDVDPRHRVLTFLPFFCLYQARRGASKSITSRSLCSLFIRSTDVKNTVCLLLNFCPPGINPELMMECKLTHIRCDKCTRRNRSESTHCPAV